MNSSDRHLVVLSCSSTKSHVIGGLPAIDRYDGPMYRVLRLFLRESIWPSPLSVAILSAKYGLIGGLASIEYYDQRMDQQRASELIYGSTETLIKWGQSHSSISLVLGRDYLPALDLNKLNSHGIGSTVVEGPIGVKLNRLHTLLHSMEHIPRVKKPTPVQNRTLYFLPDWDDMLDIDYDFSHDRFSSMHKSDRGERHCIEVMQPERICDGIVVSLAQHFGSKGVLKKFAPTDIAALAPESIRPKFGLSEDQWVFGDCGAFSYVNEPDPTITTEQAISLYQLYGFDLGASVDHIPFPEIIVNNERLVLSEAERQRRVNLTKDNAAAFIDMHRQRKCSFTPVGIIQGLTSDSYAQQLSLYVDMGYEHVAIGGLIPKSDIEILETVQALGKVKASLKKEIWIHLFGVFRPKIQPGLREWGITSFDSATYFRKSWLRSDQNYLGADGQWYAAVRVPMTSDARTRIRLQTSGVPLALLERLEQEALSALHEYGAHRRSLDSTLKAVEEYDFMLNRGADHGRNLVWAYRRTLEARPWEKCNCNVCSNIGIDVLIFRGSNRNKRRGAHNTLMLYQIVHHAQGNFVGL